MDFNFADLKKEAAATADDIFSHTTAEAKQAAANVAKDLLGDGGHGQDDNAHTEQYFANASKDKDLDFEHVDPQTFVQRMSAGAKEAQEQLDAKFAAHSHDIDDFVTQTGKDLGGYGAQLQQDVKQGMSALTHDFMNAERGLFGGGPHGDVPKEVSAPPSKPAAVAAAPPPAPPAEDDLFGVGKGDGHFAPSAPLAPIVPVDRNADLFDMDDLVNIPASNLSNKDSDTDSPSISYNPSPVKKPQQPNPVTAALKEQDNEKFISSEDLLGDFKDERTATPDFQPASAAAAASVSAVSGIKPQPVAAPIPTTDLDADDFSDNDFEQAPVPKAPVHSQAELIKDLPPTSISAPKPTPTAAAVSSEPLKPQPPAAAQPVVKDTKSVAAGAHVKDTKGQQPNIISVEEIFYKYGLVESLIYWRDVKKSGIVFGLGLVTLLAISCFSVISVFAYLSLITLTGTIAFRIYKTVMQAIQKTTDGHPFKEYLEFDLTLSQEKVQNIAGVAVAHLNGFTAELRRLFLVEDFVDSVKFGVILWVMTHVGSWFNGMTLVILAFVSLFTLPKVYENNKQSIDTYLDLVRSKLTEITDKIKVAIPIGNKKPIAAESEKDK